jgi:hypothetical protein
MAVYRAPDLDTFHWQRSVKDKDLNTPPGSPAKGDRYIVGPSPTGAWVGYAARITYYDGAAWVFVTLVEGLACWVDDEDKVYKYSGVAWAELGVAASAMGYTLQVHATSLAPQDGVSYFFGATLTPRTSSGNRLYIPKAGTIKVVYFWWDGLGTAGSNENISVYVRLNDTTDTLVETIGDTSLQKLFDNTGLSISVAQGDYIEIKMVCPDFATNPLNVMLGGCVYIE